MRAGSLRHRVTLQQRTAGSPQRTATGAPSQTWTDVATVWASVEPLRGREFLEAQAIQSKIETRIRLRYRAGVTAAMRAVHAGVVYDIHAVLNPAERNIELQLMCSRGASAG